MIEIDLLFHRFPACDWYTELTPRQKAILYTVDFLRFFIRKYQGMLEISCKNPPECVQDEEAKDELMKERRRLADNFKDAWDSIFDKDRYMKRLQQLNVEP